MTHPWLAVFKALLRVNFGLSALKHQIRSRERLWELALLALGIVVGGSAIISMVVLFSISFVQTGLSVGQPELVLTMAHLAAAIMVFVFGIAFVMSSMYFANDTAMLMSWPLRSRQIVSAKVATVLVNEYITMAVVLIPVYVVYALYVPVGPWYVVSAIIAFLFTPIIPLMLATLFAMLLMRVVGGARRRDLFTMIGSLLGIVVYVGIQYFLRMQMPGASEAELAEMLFYRLHGLSEVLAVGYPPGLWTMQSLALAGTGAGWAALLKLVAVGVVLLFAMLVIGERVFIRAVQEGRESAGRRKRKGAIAWNEGSAIDAVARVERKRFLRTPVYAINGLIGFVLFPVLLLLPMSSGSQGLSETLQELNFDPMVGALILAGWIGFSSTLSSILPTAFSREGAHRLWILKSLPVSGRDLYLGKLKAGLGITLLGSLPGAAIVIYMLRLPPVSMLLGLALGTLLAVLVGAIGLAIDMVRPMLNWTDPARAMKSNMNSLIVMIAVALLIVASILIGSRLYAWGMTLTGLLIVAIGVIAATLVVLWKVWTPRFEEWLARMGD